MDGVELVGSFGKGAGRLQVLQPQPLEDRGLEQCSRRIGVIFQKLGWTFAVIGKVEAAVEAGVAALPTVGDDWPADLGDLQPLEDAFVADCAGDEFAAKCRQFGGGVFEVAFDLLQSEAIVGGLVPIRLAIDFQQREAGLGGPIAQVLAFGSPDALHEVLPSTAKAVTAARAAETAAGGR